MFESVIVSEPGADSCGRAVVVHATRQRAITYQDRLPDGTFEPINPRCCEMCQNIYVRHVTERLKRSFRRATINERTMKINYIDDPVIRWEGGHEQKAS